MICANCHQPIRDGARYCSHCGLPVQAAAPARPYEPRQVWEAPRTVWTADPYAPPVAASAPQRPLWPPAPERAERAAVQGAQEQEAAPEILSAARLVGSFFLMLVPLVNLVCACVWSFGRRAGAQLRALARASLIVILTVWIALAGLVYLSVVYSLPQINALLDVLFGPM
jgi:hypothetical protein